MLSLPVIIPDHAISLSAPSSSQLQLIQAHITNHSPAYFGQLFILHQQHYTAHKTTNDQY